MGILFTIHIGFLLTITLGFLFTIVLGIQFTISMFMNISDLRQEISILREERSKAENRLIQAKEMLASSLILSVYSGESCHPF